MAFSHQWIRKTIERNLTCPGVGECEGGKGGGRAFVQAMEKASGAQWHGTETWMRASREPVVRRKLDVQKPHWTRKRRMACVAGGGRVRSGGRGGPAVQGSGLWLKRPGRACDVKALRVGGGLWEGGLNGRGYMYTYNWFALFYSRNQHNIVKQYPPIKN